MPAIIHSNRHHELRALECLGQAELILAAMRADSSVFDDNELLVAHTQVGLLHLALTQVPDREEGEP